MTKDVVDMEAEAEQQSSAWIEQTSSGKLKFGLKSYRLDVAGAWTDVFEQFVAFKDKIRSIEDKE